MTEKEEMDTLLDRAILRIGIAYAHMSSLIRDASCCQAESTRYLNFLREVANCGLLGEEIYALKQITMEDYYKDRISAIKEIRKEVIDCIEIISDLHRRYVEVIPNGKDLQADLDRYVSALKDFMDEELKTASEDV